MGKTIQFDGGLGFEVPYMLGYVFFGYFDREYDMPIGEKRED